jgi:hypothetical protein
MIEITTIRCPWARIALAGLNTGHPGPMPRGTTSRGYALLFPQGDVGEKGVHDEKLSNCDGTEATTSPSAPSTAGRTRPGPRYP